MRAKIQAKVAAAFNRQLADAVTTFTGSRTVAGEYDPVTGTTPTITITYSGRGVLSGYSAEEIDGQHILATDVKLIVLQNEVGETPEVNDVVAGHDVVRVSQDPAGASWIIQLRRT